MIPYTFYNSKKKKPKDPKVLFHCLFGMAIKHAWPHGKPKPMSDLKIMCPFLGVSIIFLHQGMPYLDIDL